MKYCVTPLLVALDHELPSDPSVANDGNAPIVGCNHLVCSACGVVVRSQTGLFPLAHGKRDWAAFYASDDWAAMPAMDRDPTYRLYVCRCRHEATDGPRPLVRYDESPYAWRCAGHPPATLPLTIEGLEVTPCVRRRAAPWFRRSASVTARGYTTTRRRSSPPRPVRSTISQPSRPRGDQPAHGVT